MGFRIKTVLFKRFAPKLGDHFSPILVKLITAQDKRFAILALRGSRRLKSLAFRIRGQDKEPLETKGVFDRLK
jgi:hypothetical protein